MSSFHLGNISKSSSLKKALIFWFQEAENRQQKVPIVAEVAMDDDAFVDSSDEEDMMAEEDLYQDEDDDDEVDDDSEEECEAEMARHGNRRARLEWDNNI